MIVSKTAFHRLATFSARIYTFAIHILVTRRTADTINLHLISSAAQTRGLIGAVTRKERPIILAAVLPAHLLNWTACIAVQALRARTAASFPAVAGCFRWTTRPLP